MIRVTVRHLNMEMTRHPPLNRSQFLLKSLLRLHDAAPVAYRQYSRLQLAS